MAKETLQEKYENHLKNEPEKFDKKYLKYNHNVKTSDYIGWELKKENMKDVLSITRKKRQEILDRFRKGGISIGDLALSFKVDSQIIGSIIYYNISSVKILNGESI